MAFLNRIFGGNKGPADPTQMEQRPSSDSDSRSPFQRFQSLARRTMTTPKAELVKGSKPKAAKPKGRGKK